MSNEKRGAKKLPPTAPSELDIVEKTPADIATEQAAMHTAIELYGEERDLVNQLLGQAQMAEAGGDFFRTVRSSKLAYVKENKLYRALQGKKSPNGSEFLSGTWAEFCSLLGWSADKVDLDIANLKAFGEQALESMSRMGIGYRELRQYRRLPADSQQALIEAAQAGDKEELLDLAEELIARQSSEKAALAAQVEDLKADALAKDERAAERERVIEAKTRELRQARELREQATPEERLAQLRAGVDAALMQVRVDINHMDAGDGSQAIGLRQAFTDLLAYVDDETRDDGEQHSLYLAGAIGELLIDLRVLRDALGLPILKDHGDPDWMRGA